MLDRQGWRLGRCHPRRKLNNSLIENRNLPDHAKRKREKISKATKAEIKLRATSSHHHSRSRTPNNFQHAQREREPGTAHPSQRRPPPNRAPPSIAHPSQRRPLPNRALPGTTHPSQKSSTNRAPPDTAHPLQRRSPPNRAPLGTAHPSTSPARHGDKLLRSGEGVNRE